ncbi:fimbria/pilus periplasmic chaperone [Proteus myxofaciens]|uniref:FimC family chaperone n=1 Tax=Proteus myxofaciens ATCC 19692 TaxID=1354337 RepID=A0A198GH02_9GAMM|nr:fimbria/pilus periplasmic chaperone [Proteus myxofaciens]OAT36727.1 FimC family chaperone [Proteus myxofaciens ATCC 19692]
MKTAITRKIITALLIIFCSSISIQAYAGIALGATRVIYPADQKQVKLSVINNEDNGIFLIQSWIENIDHQKSDQMIITPPLFTMNGKKENTLRIIDATNNQLPKDRESIFWINVKAIPATDKSKLNENTLQLAIISRIKLYYRPTGLSISPEKSVDELRFKRQSASLIAINPTPYYMTLTELTIGKTKLENTLVAPFSESTIDVPNNANGDVSYQTINDYGALTPKRIGKMQ